MIEWNPSHSLTVRTTRKHVRTIQSHEVSLVRQVVARVLALELERTLPLGPGSCPHYVVSSLATGDSWERESQHSEADSAFWREYRHLKGITQ